MANGPSLVYDAVFDRVFRGIVDVAENPGQLEPPRACGNTDRAALPFGPAGRQRDRQPVGRRAASRIRR